MYMLLFAREVMDNHGAAKHIPSVRRPLPAAAARVNVDEGLRVRAPTFLHERQDVLAPYPVRFLRGHISSTTSGAQNLRG